MKTLSKLILLILLSASFTACEKSSDGPSNESPDPDKGPVIGNGEAVDNALHMAHLIGNERSTVLILILILSA